MIWGAHPYFWKHPYVTDPTHLFTFRTGLESVDLIRSVWTSSCSFQLSVRVANEMIFLKIPQWSEME